ncbi:hypothetical protein ACFWCB_33230 [Streptomyces sp. NPDC060048]|uniref:hypothetical protein n=1 Tax=unclassified Streptomyces TaxID=2593676 RepID=UPI00369C2DC3
MNGFEFELEPVEEEHLSAYRGVTGRFGHVEVYREFPGPGQAPTREAHLRGDRFPETLFSGGTKSTPSLDGGWLKVDGTVAGLELVVKGLRKKSRRLEISYRDRQYTYVTGGDCVLAREGATVSLRNGRVVRGVGGTRLGTAVGDVDPTDLAVAIVLELVDTSALSTISALLAIPESIFTTPRRDEGPIA